MLAFVAVLLAVPVGLAGVSSSLPHGASLLHPGSAGAAYGRAVAFLGDLDGDGFGDFAISDPLDGPGRVFIYRGTAAGVPANGAMPVGTLSGGAEGDQFGRSLAAGDLDSDSTPDLVVGAWLAHGAGVNDRRAGRVYVFSGASLLQASGVGDARTTLIGAGGDHRLGWSVDAGMDATGDGLPDLLVGAPLWGGRGAAYVVPGDVQGMRGVEGAAASRVTGEGLADELGSTSLAFVGDLDGDQVAEWVVGAPKHASENAGRLYLLSGTAQGDVGQNAGAVWLGHQSEGLFGFSAVRHGDYLAVGAPGVGGGAIYLLDAAVPGEAEAVAVGILRGPGVSQAGWSLISGDFDGDGQVDLAAGAPLANHDGRRPGALFHVPGPVPLGTSDLAEVGALLGGTRHGGRLGEALAFIAAPDAIHAGAWLVNQPAGGSNQPAHLLLNQPPIAEFPNQWQACLGPMTPVELDGSNSHDPEGQISGYRWLKGNTPVASGRSASIELPVGYHDVRLEVTDAFLARGLVEREVAVVDMHPPDVVLRRASEREVYLFDSTITLPAAVALPPWAFHVGRLTFVADARDNCSAIDRVEFLVDGELVHTDREEPYTFSYEPPLVFPATHTVTAMAYDAAGHRSSDCRNTVGVGTVDADTFGSIGEDRLVPRQITEQAVLGTTCTRSVVEALVDGVVS